VHELECTRILDAFYLIYMLYISSCFYTAHVCNKMIIRPVLKLTSPTSLIFIIYYTIFHYICDHCSFDKVQN
jgi:hypothetical protein